MFLSSVADEAARKKWKVSKVQMTECGVCELMLRNHRENRCRLVQERWVSALSRPAVKHEEEEFSEAAEG